MPRGIPSEETTKAAGIGKVAAAGSGLGGGPVRAAGTDDFTPEQEAMIRNVSSKRPDPVIQAGVPAAPAAATGTVGRIAGVEAVGSGNILKGPVPAEPAAPTGTVGRIAGVEAVGSGLNRATAAAVRNQGVNAEDAAKKADATDEVQAGSSENYSAKPPHA